MFWNGQPMGATWRPRVGDLVRVRESVGRANGCGHFPHGGDEVGHSGRVMSDRPIEGVPSHPYLVMFDDPLPRIAIGGMPLPLFGRHYAATELEPLDA
jgi:hypothetical protein